MENCWIRWATNDSSYYAVVFQWPLQIGFRFSGFDTEIVTLNEPMKFLSGFQRPGKNRFSF